MSLADIYDDYLVAMTIGKERDPKRLFVTDVGKCPRQVALRMMQADRKPVLPQQRMMWDLAEYIEETLMKALDVAGELESYQEPVVLPDRENWGGRMDIVRRVGDKLQIVEVKTERSNSLKRNADGNLAYAHPKPNHVRQASIYHHYFDFGEDGELPPVIWYAARGGSNLPVECVIDNVDFEPIRLEMDELDTVRDNLPELPPMLPKVIKETSYGKVLKYVTPWDCGYCDFAGVSCSPDLSEQVWAELDKKAGTWSIKGAANQSKLSGWAEERAHEALLRVL